MELTPLTALQVHKVQAQLSRLTRAVSIPLESTVRLIIKKNVLGDLPSPPPLEAEALRTPPKTRFKH